MKYIPLREWLIILFLTVAFIILAIQANGQQIFPEANKTSIIKSWGGIKADSAAWAPPITVKFPLFDSAGRFGYNPPDSSFYYHNGRVWVKLMSSTSSGFVSSITVGAGLTGTPNPIVSTGTIAMPNVGTAGTYGSATGIPVFTTDAYGRISGVTTVTPTPALPSLADDFFWVGNASNVATAVQASGDATIANTGIVTIKTVTPGYVWMGGSGGTTTAQPFTGDVNSISPTGAVTFTTTGVVAGSYGDNTHIAGFTVDGKGRLTTATTYTVTSGAVTSVALSVPSVYSVSGSPITSSGTIAIAFNGGQAANKLLATPDGTTGPLSLRSLTIGDLPATTAGYIWMGGAGGTTTAQPFAGDINSVTPSGVVVFTTTGVSAGSYGSATQVGTFTVDAKGRITVAANTTITGVAPGGSAGGDLTGTYPNPTIKASVGLTGSPTATTQTVDDNSTIIATTAYVQLYIPLDTSIAASYTLTSRDKYRTIHSTAGSGITVTIPTSLGTRFTCTVIEEAAGQVTFSASGTTLTYIPTATTKTKQSGSIVTIRSWATANSFSVQGDLN